MKPDGITVLQLTDLHLFAKASGLFNGINTRDCFNQVLAHVQHHYHKPDIVILTGDLAHDGEIATYQFIARALQVFDVPVYFVLGNHDQPENAYQAYPAATISTEQHVILGNWQIVLLDSNHQPEPNSYQGEVSLAELQRLATLIAQYSDKHTMIAMHHNLPHHADRGVAVEVRNAQQVMHYFGQASHIKLVVSGHVHQEFTIVENGICYLSTPATGYQSKSKSGQITGEVAGYRWLKLYQTGRFETDVRRITVWAS